MDYLFFDTHCIDVHDLQVAVNAKISLFGHWQMNYFGIMDSLFEILTVNQVISLTVIIALIVIMKVIMFLL